MALNNFRSQMLWENIRKADLSAVVNLLENGTINLEERDDVSYIIKRWRIIYKHIRKSVFINITVDNMNWFCY